MENKAALKERQDKVREQIPNSPFLRETFILKPHDFLRRFYYKSANKSRPTKLMLSMMNAILHHRLVFFMVDHQLVGNLYRNDRNHFKHEDCFQQDLAVFEINHKLNNIIHCKRAIQIMKTKRVIREVQHATSFRPAIYEVIDRDMLNEIQATDAEIQINRLMAFAYID